MSKMRINNETTYEVIRRHPKLLTIVTIVVLVLVGGVHLLQLFMGWEITINTVGVPMWASLFACLATLGLAFMLWREM